MESINFEQVDIFVSCPIYLEILLEKEIQDILPGHAIVHARGGVSLSQVTPRQIFLLLLGLRTASRLFINLFNFRFGNESEFYQKGVELPWEEVLLPKDTFKFSTLLAYKAKDNVKNSHFYSLLAKDTLVDRLSKVLGKRPDVAKQLPDYPLYLHIDQANPQLMTAQFMLDICGFPLSNRGYRLPGHEATLRENVAAGVALFAQLQEKKTPVVDLTCGTGTLLIESMWVAKNIAPSIVKLDGYLNRGKNPWAFIFQRWFSENKKMKSQFDELANMFYQDSMKKLGQKPDQKFIGIDNNSDYLNLAKQTIERALVKNWIQIEYGDCLQMPAVFSGEGTVLSNLPYGERMEDDHLEDFYYQFGENLKKNFKGTSAFLLSSRADLRKKISLRTSARIPLMNGDLECRLYRYDLF